MPPPHAQGGNFTNQLGQQAVLLGEYLTGMLCTTRIGWKKFHLDTLHPREGLTWSSDICTNWLWVVCISKLCNHLSRFSLPYSL